MIMKNTKQCEKCVYGEHWSRVGWVCVRAFDAMRDRVYQDRIPNRTENKCFDYEKRGKKKMNAIIVEKKEENTAAPVVEKAVDTVEKSDEKPKRHTWTDEDTQTLIHFYNKGTKYVVLADMFGVPKERLQQKIYDLKKSEQWKGHFTDSTTISKTETVAEPETPVSKKRIYKAVGTGFISVDGSMKIDDKPITAELAKVISDSGLKQFYGEIEIRIKPIQPTGMTVSVEEE